MRMNLTAILSGMGALAANLKGPLQHFDDAC